LLSIIDNTEIDDLLATAKRKLEELNALEKVSGEGVKEDDE
jgi:hypothetical protein